MHFDAATQNKWILGGVIAGVHFSARQAVRIVAGPHDGKVGKLISLFDLKPEPIFHLETSDGGDVYVRQSEIDPLQPVSTV